MYCSCDNEIQSNVSVGHVMAFGRLIESGDEFKWSELLQTWKVLVVTFRGQPFTSVGTVPVSIYEQGCRNRVCFGF